MSIVPQRIHAPERTLAVDQTSGCATANAQPATAPAGVPGAQGLSQRRDHWNTQARALEQLQRDRDAAGGGEQ
jgi:hypothetical protein